MPRRQMDAKPRARISAYAFFVQACKDEHRRRNPEDGVIFADFSKRCAERWKTMSDIEKRRFVDLSEEDKARYDREIKEYVPKSKESKSPRKRRQNKDPNAPKRSLSAFFWFCNDERGKIKSMNPDFGVGDIAKELGKLWSEADPDVKKKYEAMAERDKARYEKEMQAYKAQTQGLSQSQTEFIPNNNAVKLEPMDDDEEGDDE